MQMLELFQTEWCPHGVAAKARRRYVEEECECLRAATR